MTEAPEARVTPEREAAIRAALAKRDEAQTLGVWPGWRDFDAPDMVRDLLDLLDAERAKVAELDKKLDTLTAISWEQWHALEAACEALRQGTEHLDEVKPFSAYQPIKLGWQTARKALRAIGNKLGWEGRNGY